MGYRRNGHIEPKLQWAINTQKDQIANRLKKVDNQDFSPDGIKVAGSNISEHTIPGGIYHTARAIKIFKDKYGRYPNTRQEYDRFIPTYLDLLYNHGENKADELERAVHRWTMLHDVQGHLEKAQDPGDLEKNLNAAQTRFMITLPSAMNTDISNFDPKNPRSIEELNRHVHDDNRNTKAQNDSLIKFKKQLLGLEPADDLNSYLGDFEMDWNKKKWNNKN